MTLHPKYRHMRAHSKARRIVETLHDGPGLVAEIAAELNISPKNACANLHRLWQRGLIDRRLDRSGAHERWLYSVNKNT